MKSRQVKIYFLQENKVLCEFKYIKISPLKLPIFTSKEFETFIRKYKKSSKSPSKDIRTRGRRYSVILFYNFK